MAQDRRPGTEHYQIDPATGATLIGGDMNAWSDRGHQRPDVPQRTTPRPAAAPLQLVRRVLSERRPRSVLLVGPHAADLLDDLDRTTAVAVLVRGTRDAADLTTRSGLHDDLTVYCGGLDRFAAEREYDLVVALDGRETLLTPDSRPLPQVDFLRHLHGLVADGGVLVTELRNDLGTDGMLRLPTPEGREGWHRGAEGFDRSPHWRELLGDGGLLADAGLGGAAVYAGYPAIDELALLVTAEAVADADRRAALSTLAVREAADYFSRQPALSSPARLTAQVFDAGLAMELAPAWLVVAGADSLPGVVYAETGPQPAWQATLESRAGEQGWARTAYAADGSTRTQEGALVRDYCAIGDAPLGRVLESALFDACRERDEASVRHLVQAYAAWLRDDAAWDDPSTRLFATVDNVVVISDGSMRVFDPSWRWLGEADGDLALARGLRRFARRLVASGSEHPWRPHLAPDRIAETLALSVGLPWDEDIAGHVADIEAGIEAVLTGADGEERERLRERERTAGSSELTALASPSSGYRESLMRTAALAQELRTSEGRIDWLERHVEWRDRQFTGLESRIKRVEGSMPYKVTEALVEKPKKKVLDSARQTVLSQLPPGFKEKAEKAARKMLEKNS